MVAHGEDIVAGFLKLLDMTYGHHVRRFINLHEVAPRMNSEEIKQMSRLLGTHVGANC